MGVVTVDFDGTLFQGDSFNVIMKGANQVFGVRQWPVVGKSLTKAAASGVTKGKNAFKLTFFETFAQSFKGMTARELNDFFHHLVEIGKEDVHHDLLGKIHEHKRRGDQVIVLSGAFKPFLEAFTQVFNLDVTIIGTELIFDHNGLCTGEVKKVINGDEKVNHMYKWINEQYQSGYLSLKETCDTWAYADSKSDIPLLQFVKNPFIVNPDKSVKKIAIKEGWPLFG